VRAGLLRKADGFDSAEWTSLREYRKPPSKRFEWMETAKGFECCELKDTVAGRRKFIERLEQQVDWSKANEAGRVLWEGQGLQSTLRRGWYFGEQAFREKLLKIAGLDREKAVTKNRKLYTSAELKDLDLKVAEKIVKEGLRVLEVERKALPGLPKNDPRKALLAHLLMERTSVRQKWIVEQLGMGSAPYVSRLAREVREKLEKGDRKTAKLKDKIVRIIT
jgi:hypothetical protein